MNEELQFLRALFNQPDDALRLVYADWLEERGDRRAEYLRLEVALNSLPKGAKSQGNNLRKQITEVGHGLDDNWISRMWMLRHRPDGVRLDLANVEDGRGLIEVRGSVEDVVLLVEDKPVAINWDDRAGSVGQYLVFTGHTGGSEFVQELRDLVSGEIDERPLADQIMPLLSLFANGVYSLAYEPKVKNIGIFPYSASTSDLGSYYPYDRNLVYTQPSESLDEKRVRFYRKQIRNGQRPILLTTSAEEAWCEFVIDGHHKLEAYKRQQTRPAILSISRWYPPAIAKAEGLAFFPRGHRGIKHYRQMKS